MLKTACGIIGRYDGSTPKRFATRCCRWRGDWMVGWAARRSNPSRVAEDAAKRLRSGPLDGEGRRSIYLKMTLMEPPRFLALFNQPIPKLTAGRRDATNVPDQALALLNDPLVIAMARHWSERCWSTGPARRSNVPSRCSWPPWPRPATSEETGAAGEAGRAQRRAARGQCRRADAMSACAGRTWRTRFSTSRSSFMSSERFPGARLSVNRLCPGCAGSGADAARFSAAFEPRFWLAGLCLAGQPLGSGRKPG